MDKKLLINAINQALTQRNLSKINRAALENAKTELNKDISVEKAKKIGFKIIELIYRITDHFDFLG